MNISSSCVQVCTKKNKPHTSSGYAFNSICGTRSFVITSKHSVCLEKVDCSLVVTKGPANECRSCKTPIDPSVVNIKFHDSDIHASSIVVSDSSDVALVEIPFKDGLNELSTSSDCDGKFYVWNGKGEKINLDMPTVPSDDYISYNVYSNINAGLDVKTNVMKGFSGAVIFSLVGSKYLPKAIITDDEEINNVGGESISSSLLSELSEKLDLKFSKFTSTLSEALTQDFLNDNFNFVKEYEINSSTSLKVYAADFDNKFILKKVAYSLIDNIAANLLTPKEIEQKGSGAIAAIKAIKRFSLEQSSSYSNSSLLQMLVESGLLAPKIYTNSLTDDGFHSVHIRECEVNLYEMIFSKFYSNDDFIGSLNQGLNDILTLKAGGKASSVFLNEQFLNSELSKQHAEIISQLIIPGSECDYITSFGILNTFTPKLSTSISTEKTAKLRNIKVKQELVSLIDSHTAEIMSCMEDDGYSGSNYYIYTVPLNNEDELRSLMLEVLDEQG